MKVMQFFVVLTLLAALTYAGYWLAKTVSYSVFYEDMVQDTVREMVKTESLKDVAP